LTIARLFGRSPFSTIQGHMKQVAACMGDLRPLMQAFWGNQTEQVAAIAAKIGEQEHRADQLKADIRNQMGRGVLLPVDMHHLHAALTLQDDLADKAEDIAVLVALRPIQPLASLHAAMDAFLDKNLECFDVAWQVVREIPEVLETGFGGPELVRLRERAKRCAFLEHEGDVLQRQMLRLLYAQEEHLTFITFDFWSRLISEIGSIADLSENLADRVRLMTEGS
jgi:predicted phosphate transport protein (TIGR00153 family)